MFRRFMVRLRDGKIQKAKEGDQFPVDKIESYTKELVSYAGIQNEEIIERADVTIIVQPLVFFTKEEALKWTPEQRKNVENAGFNLKEWFED